MTFPVIRTPDERFEDLDDYPFEPNYRECFGYRIHYVDEGFGQNPIVLLLHGEPSWSYLYRKMIPLLVEKGFRVIAPDLLGFGKSDKLTNGSHYSYQLLVNVMNEFVKQLKRPVEVMFMQDWGSLIGFRLMGTAGDKINRVLLSNGAFPQASGLKGMIGHFLFKMRIKLAGKVTQEKLSENPNFVNWVAYSQNIKDFPVGDIIQGASVTELSDNEIRAYNAPFPDDTYKEGVRQLPMLVTSELGKNSKVWERSIKTWNKPFLTIFGKGDPITKGNEGKFIAKVPGAKGLKHDLLDQAGHFIQEDQPERLVDEIVYLSQV